MSNTTGHYEQNLAVKVGTMTLGPNRKVVLLELVVIEHYRRREGERRGGINRHVPGGRKHTAGRRRRPFAGKSVLVKSTF